MRLTAIVAATGISILAAGCHTPQRQSPPATTPRAEGTIFTDSAMHAARCEPNKPGENWRTVCTPRDQSTPPALPKPPIHH